MIEEIMETVGEELDFFMAALLMKSEEFDATFLHELIDNGNETSFALLEILCSKTVKELHAIGQQYSKSKAALEASRAFLVVYCKASLISILYCRIYRQCVQRYGEAFYG